MQCRSFAPYPPSRVPHPQVPVQLGHHLLCLDELLGSVLGKVLYPQHLPGTIGVGKVTPVYLLPGLSLSAAFFL